MAPYFCDEPESQRSIHKADFKQGHKHMNKCYYCTNREPLLNMLYCMSKITTHHSVAPTPCATVCRSPLNTASNAQNSALHLHPAAHTTVLPHHSSPAHILCSRLPPASLVWPTPKSPISREWPSSQCSCCSSR